MSGEVITSLRVKMGGGDEDIYINGETVRRSFGPIGNDVPSFEKLESACLALRHIAERVHTREKILGRRAGLEE